MKWSHPIGEFICILFTFYIPFSYLQCNTNCDISGIICCRARDEELIDFFQNAPIAMHWLNGNGTVLWANQTELNVLGYTAEEYIGKSCLYTHFIPTILNVCKLTVISLGLINRKTDHELLSR